jgi:hypothetical protein
MYDEAHLHLHGDTDRQNYLYWATETPHKCLESPLHSP